MHTADQLTSVEDGLQAFRSTPPVGSTMEATMIKLKTKNNLRMIIFSFWRMFVEQHGVT